MTRISQPLPAGLLTKEVHFACEASNWAEINRRLRADAPNEACVFLLAYPSRGYARTTVLLRDPVWPLPGEVDCTPQSIEVSSDYISRAMDACIDAGDAVGLVLVHTHPAGVWGKGYGRFSDRDDWYEARLFPTLTLGRPGAIAGSIVLGSEPQDVDARIWWNPGTGLLSQPAQLIRIVGPEISFLETPYSDWKDHPDPEVMDRSTRLWGVQGRRRLQNLRVGIVGAGGTGSIALISLAQMGVGKIRVWDKDIIKKENLHRMLGATSTMTGSSKAISLAAAAKLLATANPFEVDPIDEWGTSAEGLRGLKDCDVIFCCVDKLRARVPLNDLAYAHLIPTFDIASWIHPSGDKVDAIVTHAHVWSPGIPCAWCRQTLSSRELTREAQGNQRDIQNIYGLPVDGTDPTEPSVLPLNLAGVSLALLEFMQVALKVSDRTPRDLKLFLPEWELDESDLETQPSCRTEQNVALGDTVRIRPTS